MVLGITFFSLFILTNVIINTENFLRSAIDELYQLSINKPSQPLNLKREDLLGDLFRGIYVAGVKLGDDIAQAKQDNSNALRIVQGLKHAQSSVFIANANRKIIFVNETANHLFLQMEKELSKLIPEFTANKLLGLQLEDFQQIQPLQKTSLDKLENISINEFDLCGHLIRLTIKPVLDAGERIGFICEWLDRSIEIKIEHEIEKLVSEIRQGNLSERIDLSDKSGFMKSLSISINDLTDVIEHVFNDVNRIIAKMAEGDLTNGIQGDYQGIYAECRDSINDAISKISQFIMQVNETAKFVNSSSQEIACGNNNLSQRVEQQAANLEQTAASMQELTTSVQNNAQNTENAITVVKSAIEVAEKGGNIVNNAISAMRGINESSNRISDIISVIDEIAFQTNLLALNASVEAARAGEQGLGFSVVATEVRNLAQRSASAAQQISALIDNSVKEVRSGTEFVNQTGNALTEIVNNVLRVSDIVDHITLSSSEQSHGINQINSAISQIDDITQQNATLAHQSAASSIAMSEQSAKLIALLHFFKINKNGI
jgi:methyl-accepting chemotaxis protein